jgi:pimeloyl-ACP methyl ester carboxylesterase
MTAPVRSVIHDGVGIAYRSSGSGPAVLCIQGVGVAGDGWNPQVEALAQRYRVITFDNRGVGATPRGTGRLTIERMAADAVAILDAEGIKRCHLLSGRLPSPGRSRRAGGSAEPAVRTRSRRGRRRSSRPTE